MWAQVSIWRVLFEVLWSITCELNWHDLLRNQLLMYVNENETYFYTASLKIKKIKESNLTKIGLVIFPLSPWFFQLANAKIIFTQNFLFVASSVLFVSPHVEFDMNNFTLSCRGIRKARNVFLPYHVISLSFSCYTATTIVCYHK